MRDRVKDQSMLKPLTVYEAFSPDRVGLDAWRTMLAELWRYRELIQRLVMRNIAGQFRQSFLRYFWVAIPPVATALIFGMLRRSRILNIDVSMGEIPYPLFVLIGTTYWGFFQQVTIMATTSISNAGSLVSKVYFPREVIVFSSVAGALVNLAIRLVVLILAFFVFSYTPHMQILFAPLLFVPLCLLGTGIGLLLAPIDTMMRDMSQALNFLFQFGLFLVPAVYRTPSLSEAYQTIGSNHINWKMLVFWAHNLSPVSHMIRTAVSLIENGTVGSWMALSIASICSLLVFLIGWRFFHICEPLLAERL